MMNGVHGVRVLLVEDDSDTRDMMMEALSIEGHDVVTASNGAEALERAARVLPDVILLDLMMPVMDGWQFRRLQLQHPVLAAIPVIVISALGNQPGLDAAAYVAKPCSVDAVFGAISEHAR